MSKKLPKKIIPTLRGAIKFQPCQPSRKSFSLPEKICHKAIPIRNIQDRINENEIDSETSYETVTHSITSLDDDTDFSYDSDELEYSSIEIARFASNTSNTLYSDQSSDVLVIQKSIVLKDFSSDPCEFFHQNHPLATSTPEHHSQAFSNHLIKNSDQFSNFIKPAACSTPIKEPLSCRLFEDETVTNSITSLDDDTDFSYDTLYSDQSSDVLVIQKSIVLKDFSSDPCEFFHQNHPLATSTPEHHSQAFSNHLIKNSDQFSNFIKPAACSTPIKEPLSRCLFEEYKKLKSFMDLAEQENTIIEPATISLTSPAVKDNQEATNSGLESINESLLFLNDKLLTIQDGLSELTLTAHDTNSINRVVNIKESKLKTKTKSVEYAFPKTNTMKKETICNTNSKENEKHVPKAERLENIPICFLSLRPKHLKPVIQQSRSVKDKLKSTNPESAELPECNRVALRTVRYKNIPVCPLSLPPKDLIPVISQRRSKIKSNKKNEGSGERGKSRKIVVINEL